MMVTEHESRNMLLTKMVNTYLYDMRRSPYLPIHMIEHNTKKVLGGFLQYFTEHAYHLP